MRRRATRTSLLWALLAAGVLVPHGRADADARTLVFINSEPASVAFNDGDSFLVASGPYAGSRTRLGGFNTLETFGPAHRWGTWHPYELYVISKMATLNARRGVWHCTTEGETDTYGRILLDCPDLAVDHIRKGLAHAMNVDDTPSRPEYIRAQQDAIRHRRGMWAHGIPNFIMTSLHSYGEDPDRDTAYNRMISTRDGHSEPWEHRDRYNECQWVCAMEIQADQARVRDFARRLRADPELAPLIAELSNTLLIEIVDRYARLSQLPEWVEEPLAARLRGRLEPARRGGTLGQIRQEQGSCGIYVEFLRRYGDDRPACLRGHGEAH